MKARWMAVPVFVVAVATLVLLGSVAGAAPVEISSLPWFTSGQLPTAYTNTPSGQCNLKEALPTVADGSVPWGFSLACQMETTASALDSTFRVPETDLPGATGGFWTHFFGADCGDSPGNFLNSNCQNLRPGSALSHYDDGTEAFGFGVYSGVANFQNCSATISTLWDLSAFDLDSDHYTCPGNASHLQEMCIMATWQESPTEEGSPSAYAVQFKMDCIFPPDGADTAFHAPGTTSGSCNFGDGSQDARITQHDGTTLHLFVAGVTCVGWSGNHEALMANVYWAGGTPSDTSPCGLVGISGNGNETQNEAAGTIYSNTVTYGGNAAWIIADPGDHPSGDDVSTTVGSFAFLLAPDATVTAATGSPQKVSYVPDRTGSFTPEFSCVTSSGELVPWGVPGGVGFGGLGDGSSNLDCNSAGCWIDVSTCLSTTGLGLDPSSWVPGLVSDLGCLLSWAFIPASVDTSSLTSPFSSSFPGSWVADAVAAVATLHVGLSGAFDASACDGPVISFGSTPIPFTGSAGPFSMHFPSPASLGCTGGEDSNVGELYGARQIVRDGGRFLVWSAGFLAVWRMAPWRRQTGDDPPLGGGSVLEHDPDKRADMSG